MSASFVYLCKSWFANEKNLAIFIYLFNGYSNETRLSEKKMGTHIVCVQSRPIDNNPNQYSFDWQPKREGDKTTDVDDF